jgi:hypothetical protein
LPVWEDAATANKQNNKSMQLDPGPDNAGRDMSAMRGGSSSSLFGKFDLNGRAGSACRAAVDQKIESATARTDHYGYKS